MVWENNLRKSLSLKFNFILLFGLLFYFPFQLRAESDTVKIPFNSYIPFEISPNSYKFELHDSKNNILKFDELKLKTFKFQKPGIIFLYPKSIHDHENGHDCSLIHLPDTIIIQIDNYKMEFIGNSFKLNRPIIKNRSTKGNYIEIKVNITDLYENTPIVLNYRKLYTAGIGTSIYGILDSNHTELKKGINTLRYNLDGICTMNSYIQFDFIDNVGKAHSISLPSPVKDN